MVAGGYSQRVNKSKHATQIQERKERFRVGQPQNKTALDVVDVTLDPLLCLRNVISFFRPSPQSQSFPTSPWRFPCVQGFWPVVQHVASASESWCRTGSLSHNIGAGLAQNTWRRSMLPRKNGRSVQSRSKRDACEMSGTYLRSADISRTLQGELYPLCTRFS